MTSKEKELLLALEADATALVTELQSVFMQNPLIFTAIQDSTEIIHRIVMIEAKLDNLKTARTVMVDKARFAEIIKDNLDNWGLLEDDGETRRELISHILYDLDNAGFAFVKVEPNG